MKEKKQKKLFQNIILLVIGILVSLVFFECFLRIYGEVLITSQKSKNNIPMDDSVIKILTLGESTTADISQHSWPRQLEIILNNESKTKKYKVFNEGIPGVDTSVILSNLEKNLDYYEPDIVITMMGINDAENNKYNPDYKISFIKKIKIISFIKWFKDNISKEPKSVIMMQKFVKNSYLNEVDCSKIIFELKNNFQNSDSIENKAKLEFQDKISPKVSKGEDWDWIYGEQYEFLDEINSAKYFYTKSIIKNSSVIWPYLSLARFFNGDKDYETAFCLYKEALKIEPNNLVILMRLDFFFHVNYNKPGFLSRFDYYVSRNNDDDYIDSIIFNYNYLYNELQNKKIKYYAMQYPTLNISRIELLFNDTNDVVLISNKENFEHALKEKRYNDLFTDHLGNFVIPLFNGDFGHTTKYGDYLIARNVADIILKENN